MDIVDGGMPHKQFVHGKVMDPNTKKFIHVPPELSKQATRPYKLALDAAHKLFQLGTVDGVKYGTMCPKISSIYLCRRGLLFIYNRRMPGNYRLED